MAKAKDIAALAGLAGLAYAMRNKPEQENKGRQSEDAGYKSTETRKDEGPTADKKTKSDVLEAITKPKEKANDAAGNQGVLGGNKLAPKAAPKAAPELETYTTRSKYPGGVEKRIEGNKPMPSLTAVESRAASNKTDAMRNASRKSAASSTPKAPATPVKDTAVSAAKTVAKTVAQGPAGALATAAKPVADKAANAMGETYRDLSGKVRRVTPDTSSAAKTVSDAVASGVKKVGSGIADYVKNFETPAERRSREAKETKDTPPKARTDSPLGRKMEGEILNNMITNPPMKKGGMVKPKKMASGGMTSKVSSASSRADGIASRGKTRCKMY
jgi:hypothetical protein